MECAKKIQPIGFNLRWKRAILKIDYDIETYKRTFYQFFWISQSELKKKTNVLITDCVKETMGPCKKKINSPKIMNSKDYTDKRILI